MGKKDLGYFTKERTAFDYLYTDEPHASRRVEMLKKHPELKGLFVRDPSFPYVVAANVITQFIISYYLRDKDWLLVVIMAYVVGAVFNHGLLIAMHDCVHNLAFGAHRPLANKLFAIFTNAPMGNGGGVAIRFKELHFEHHRYQGYDEIDYTLPHALEYNHFNTPLTRFFWLLLIPFFRLYHLFIINHREMSALGKLSVLSNLVISATIRQIWGGKSAIYFGLSTIIHGGWHPTAGRYLQEHLVFKENQETYSYYGPFNHVMFNVGYHVEHHDLPYIPNRYLPLVRKIAPEFYSDLYHHTSWLHVLYAFVFHLGLFARINRQAGVTDVHRFTDTTSVADMWEAACSEFQAYIQKLKRFGTTYLGMHNKKQDLACSR